MKLFWICFRFNINNHDLDCQKKIWNVLKNKEINQDKFGSNISRKYENINRCIDDSVLIWLETFAIQDSLHNFLHHSLGLELSLEITVVSLCKQGIPFFSYILQTYPISMLDLTGTLVVFQSIYLHVLHTSVSCNVGDLNSHFLLTQ